MPRRPEGDAARRVVITGLGCVSPLGSSVDELWRGLSAGRSGIAPLDHPAKDWLRVPTYARMRGFDPDAHFTPRQLLFLDIFAQMALVAARQAASHARLDRNTYPSHRVGVVIGSCFAARTADDVVTRQMWNKFQADEPWSGDPLAIPRTMGNAATSHVGIEFGFTGPSLNLATACATGNHAIGMAALLIRQGMIDAALAGASDTCFNMTVLKAWSAMRVLSPDDCRPFCAERNGLVIGDGAGVVTLESLAAARARGAPILAELVGFGMGADAEDLTKPSATGAAAVMQAALDDAGLEADEIDYINAHGTGTRLNDQVETAAIHQVFGAVARSLSISSTKSMTGHLMGASGAIELIATVMALRDGLVPPTINFGTAAPECDLDYTPNVAIRRQLRAALSNSFAFGGLNATLAVAGFNG